MELPEISIKLREGIQEKRMGNYEKALSLYTEAKQLDPTNLDVYGNSARIYGGLLEYDMFLRNVLTRQHLGELLIPDNQIDWISAMVYYAHNGSIDIPLDYDFEVLITRLAPKSPQQRIKLNFCVSDYALTKAVGVAFCAQPENENLRDKLGVSIVHLENSLKVFLGQSTGSTFAVYNPGLDPYLALIGLNVIYVNLYINRGASIDNETFDPLVISKLYFDSDVDMNWSTRFF